jgi:hypothetical protein
MGQLFQRENCPICGKPMLMASPPRAEGPLILRCLECDPLCDDKAVAWVESELQPPETER